MGATEINTCRPTRAPRVPSVCSTQSVANHLAAGILPATASQDSALADFPVAFRAEAHLCARAAHSRAHTHPCGSLQRAHRRHDNGALAAVRLPLSFACNAWALFHTNRVSRETFVARVTRDTSNICSVTIHSVDRINPVDLSSYHRII